MDSDNTTGLGAVVSKMLAFNQLANLAVSNDFLYASPSRALGQTKHFQISVDVISALMLLLNSRRLYIEVDIFYMNRM